MLLFNINLGEFDKKSKEVNHREAVRAVIFKDNLVLMVKTNKGDYKFAGGGLEGDEDYHEALIREVREETGYIINKVLHKIGLAVERYPDKYEADIFFEMASHYYLCEVEENCVLQELEDYEKEQDFRPEWISINEAIQNNEKIKNSSSKNRWVNRETQVLRQLLKCL